MMNKWKRSKKYKKGATPTLMTNSNISSSNSKINKTTLASNRCSSNRHNHLHL